MPKTIYELVLYISLLLRLALLLLEERTVLVAETPLTLRTSLTDSLTKADQEKVDLGPLVRRDQVLQSQPGLLRNTSANPA